jgi:hypothetical protein
MPFIPLVGGTIHPRAARRKTAGHAVERLALGGPP